MKILFLRPYYGITINSDMHGDLGVTEYYAQVFPDLSLVYAATIAKGLNYGQIEILDANAEKLMPQNTLARITNAFNIIIVKIASPTVKYDLEFAQYLKKIFPKARIVICGHIVKMLKKWIEKNIPEIDDVIEKPIEASIYEILTGKKKLLTLGDFPSPDYTLFPYKKYIDAYGASRGTLYMSQGCIMGCQYCPYYSYYGKNIHIRSAEKGFEDIMGLLGLGIKTIAFRDQFFTYAYDNIKKLCEMIISKNIMFKWRCETRLDSLTPEIIDLMAAAGLECVYFGIESASKKILDQYNRKTFSINKERKIIDYIHEKNIDTIAFYIIGFPDDNWISIKKTLDLARQIDSKYIRFGIFYPNIFENCVENISPGLFEPFQDNLSLSPSKNLTLNEINFLRDQLSLLYYSEKKNLQYVYEYEFQKIESFNEKRKLLKKQLESCSIFDLQELPAKQNLFTSGNKGNWGK